MSEASAVNPSAAEASASGPDSRAGGNAALIDPGALMRIKNLEMRARVVVEGFLSGLHRSPYHGFSVEFSEYRQYTPGDDLRYLDWKLFARSDRYYVKRFEDETNLRCYLVVDLSRSMQFTSLEYDKADYARTLGGTLAYFLATQRDAVGLVVFDEEITELIPPRYRPGHIHRLLSALDRTPGGQETDLSRPLEQIARMVTKRGVVVLITDFLAPLENVETSLRQLRTHGHEVVLFRVLDPAELTFQFDDPTLFFDLETGRNLYVDPQTVREDYLRQFNEHAQALDEMCGALGVDYQLLTTDQPLEYSLYDFLSARLRRGRQVMRKGQFGGRGG